MAQGLAYGLRGVEIEDLVPKSPTEPVAGWSCERVKAMVGSAQDRSDDQDRSDEQDRPGDSACWAHLVCPSCGGMEDEGHQRGCALGPGSQTETSADPPTLEPDPLNARRQSP